MKSKDSFRKTVNKPKAIGAGIVVLDIILNNGATIPIYRAGGTCGNVLAGLSFLGWETVAISRAGSDLASGIMISDLANNGVNTNYITREDGLVTPRIVEKLSSNGSHAKHSFPQHCPSCERYLPRFRSPRLDTIENIFRENSKVDVYIFDKITPSTLKLARKYRQADALIFFEPSSLRNMDMVEQGISVCHVFKYTSDHTNGRHGLNKCSEILKLVNSYRTPLVIQTQGEGGLLYWKFGEEACHEMKSYNPQELIDTCGAGDWVTIGLLYYLEETTKNNKLDLIRTFDSSLILDEALSFAQILSSLSCMFPGARGLSDATDRDLILQLIMSKMKMPRDTIVQIRSDQLIRRNEKDVPDKRVIGKEVCSTCLLYTKQVDN